MNKSLYSGVNKVYFRSYLLLNIVASSAYIIEIDPLKNQYSLLIGRISFLKIIKISVSFILGLELN